MELIVITGISGAGKSSALDVMEDLGYYTMDNIPPQLLSKFVELYTKTNTEIKKAAVVLDIRTGEFFKEIPTELKRIKELGVDYKLIFIDAKDSVLIQRYKEFRRPHPLSLDGSVTEGIKREREMLFELKEQSDYVIDTSRLSIHKLKAEVLDILKNKNISKMQISIVSFGYKNSILADADFVFDVRFLPNPYYIEELKNLRGTDKAVKDYVFSFEESKIYAEKIADMIKFLAPYYQREGKLQLVVGIGCTGGHHRSVAVSEYLKDILEKENLRIVLAHRDI